jgi:tetratricopeptide (TPR) repeat protein
MRCPRCGKPIPGDASRCNHCGAGFATTTSVATGVVAIDTTGLPPGATFGPSTGATGATGDDAPTGAANDSAVTDIPGGGGGVEHDGPLKIGQSFSPRYHIIKLLGAGGMGAVYQAWDAELGVAVALKVIKTDARRKAGASEAEKRFKQELLLARQVTHKNVVRIHDLGEIDGIKFITMPYVKGQDLSTVLRRELKLPVRRALRLARQMAAGMQAAHDAGVVHRDLKPANIMISKPDDTPAAKGAKADESGEQALIMDFGISASSSEDLSGIIIGTLEYMAPEQAAGKDLDARADIYAFGLILYECLLGLRLTAAALTPAARVEAMKYRCAEGVVALRTVDRTIPEPLEAIIMKCLERDPANRYATTADLVKALDDLDEDGNRLPIVRRLTKPMMAAAAVTVAGLLAGTYYTAKWLSAPVKPHDPVAVVIADLKNTTGDTTFDHLLEPIMRRDLERAGFISAYDRGGVIRTFGVKPATFDEAAAREVAAKQGLGVVVSGSIDKQGSGYGVSVKAVQTVTGAVVASVQGNASGKDDVVGVAEKQVAAVRKALGDRTSESAQIFAKTSVSATSLDVIKYYAAAQEAASNNKFDEARDNALKAVQLDPKFGVGYLLLSSYSRNLGKMDDSTKYANEALRYLDSMTERERFSTRGFLFRLKGDYPQCVKEYGEMVSRFTADVVAHNQRALCLSKLRDLKGAGDEMRPVVQLLPKRNTFRDNLALYANYAGDFPTGEKEARTITEPDPYASLALAFSQLGQNQIPYAIETLQGMPSISRLGATFSASGLGDVASLQGRFSEGVQILEAGAGADLTAKNPDRAAAKYAAAAYARLQQGKNAEAIAEAEKALANSKAITIKFLAARVLAEAGSTDRARALGAELSGELLAEPQAYGKIVEGDIALKGGKPRDAVKAFTEANKLFDTWIGHFDLGRGALEAGELLQADSEFDICLKRRGEALSLFLDEEQTYAFFAPVYYYQARTREAMKTANFTDGYREYLGLRGKSTEDPLVPDVKRRAGI